MQHLFRTALPVLLLVGMLCPRPAGAQCLLIPTTLEARMDAASLIVEAEVLDQTAVWAADQSLILTLHRLRPTHLVAGALPAATLTLVTLGGQVGADAHIVTPEAKLRPGERGVLFLEPYAGKPLPTTAPPHAHQLAVGPQGWVRYNPADPTQATDGLARYDVPSQLWPALVARYGPGARPAMPTTPAQPLGKALAPVINSLSPTILRGGNFEVLTIQGSGFGSSPGKVQFNNPDDGGNSFVEAPADAIQSWADNRIELWVPTDAGTGPLRVETSGGEGVVSDQELTITYSLLTVSHSSGIRPPNLVSRDQAGGYTLRMHNALAANPASRAAFERAFINWRCQTAVGWQLAGGSTSNGNCSQDDGVNVVAFSQDCGQVGSGVLARTFSYYTGCGLPGQTLDWYLAGFDLIFQDSPSGGGWAFGPGNPLQAQSDFESVALHELGHAFQLAHNLTGRAVMYYAIGRGNTARALTQEGEVDGGRYVITRSEAPLLCNVQDHESRSPDAQSCTAVPAVVPLQDPLSRTAPSQPTWWPQWSPGQTHLHLMAPGQTPAPQLAQLVGPMGRVLAQWTAPAWGQPLPLPANLPHGMGWLRLVWPQGAQSQGLILAQ